MGRNPRSEGAGVDRESEPNAEGNDRETGGGGKQRTNRKQAGSGGEFLSSRFPLSRDHALVSSRKE